jgi:hypothetical protein
METIEDVWITTSSMGDKTDVGEGVMPRLFALGVILYELFAGREEPPLSEDDLPTVDDASSSNMLSLNLIDLRS